MAEATMTIEEHTNSNSNVSASKKLKQKRVPQRGLGVAQLERIRLEEQQIKDEILTPNPVVSSQDSTFRDLKPASVLENCDFRLNSSTPFVDNLSPKKGLQSPKLNVSEGEMNLSAVLGKGCDDVCSKKDHDEKLYHHGVVIHPPIFSLPQYQQLVCSSSMRVGIKRPYPFPPEFPPVPAFHCKFPPRYDAPLCTDSRTFFKREVPLKSRTLPDAKPRTFVRQHRALSGDFLTLAPPTAVGAGTQQESSNSAPQNTKLVKFKTLPFQVVPEDHSTRSGLNRSVQQHVFRFFPPPNVQIGQPGNTHGEVGGKVDLNLKL